MFNSDLPPPPPPQVTAAVSAVLVSVTLANNPCTSTPANQNAALKALYDNTNGPNWVVLPNVFGSPWTAGDACATRFRGVYCTRRITPPGTSVCDVSYVDVQAFNLQGPVPSSLTALSQLSTLILGGNPGITNLPSNLKSLTKLTRLDLNSLGLQGSVPAFVTALTNLQDLSLGNNSLTATIPATLSNLKKLTNLDLSVNFFQGVLPKDLSKLVNLEQLSINYVETLGGTIPTGLGALVKLSTLSFAGDTGISGTLPVSFSALSKLQTFSIWDCALRGTIPTSWAGGLKAIKSIDIGRNYLGGSIPSVFSRWHGVYVNTCENNGDFTPVPAWGFAGACAGTTA